MPNHNSNRQPASASPAETVETETAATIDTVVEAAPAEKLIEVELLRKYAPVKFTNDEGELVEQGEITVTYPKGTTLTLPATEAQRALKLGIASVTLNTFA